MMVKVAKERFIKHIGYDQNDLLENSNGFKLVYQLFNFAAGFEQISLRH